MYVFTTLSNKTLIKNFKRKRFINNKLKIKLYKCFFCLDSYI